MAKTAAKKKGSSKKRKYSRSSGSDVKNEMRRYKKGTAKSGRGGKGGKVKSRKQAIAIGLSKARKKGKKYLKRNRPVNLGGPLQRNDRRQIRLNQSPRSMISTIRTRGKRG